MAIFLIQLDGSIQLGKRKFNPACAHVHHQLCKYWGRLEIATRGQPTGLDQQPFVDGSWLKALSIRKLVSLGLNLSLQSPGCTSSTHFCGGSAKRSRRPIPLVQDYFPDVGPDVLSTPRNSGSYTKSRLPIHISFTPPTHSNR